MASVIAIQKLNVNFFLTEELNVKIQSVLKTMKIMKTNYEVHRSQENFGHEGI